VESVLKTAIQAFYGVFVSNLMKKIASDKLIQIYACGISITPYNAAPLRRNNGKQAAGSTGVLKRTPTEKSEIKCLTLKEESVIYATSQQ
jgi:hypothetical protein